MLKQGQWKYHHHVGFPPERFDLETAPQELIDLGQCPDHTAIRDRLHLGLLDTCDVEAVDAKASADQKAIIERSGGRETVLRLGAPRATPPPFDLEKS